MTASAIIKALRSRLENAGHDVTLFRVIDAENDTLPVVGVFFDRDDGEETETDEFGPQKRRLNLDVVRVSTPTGSDPEMEALEAAESLAADLLTNRADRLDDIDGTCRYAEQVELTIEARELTDDPIVSHVRLRAHY